MKLNSSTKQTKAHRIGTLRSLSLMRSFRNDPISLMNDLQRDHGDLVELSLGPKKLLICSHPDYAEQILKSNADHYRKSRLIFDKIIPITGRDGLVQVEGEEGRKQRQLTGAALTHDAIQMAFPALTQSITQGLDEIDAASSNGREIDLAAHITEIILRNAVILVLGQECDAQSLGKAFLEANQICGARIRNLVAPPSFLPTRGNRRLKKCIDWIDREIYSAIDRKKRSQNQESSSPKDKDLLSILTRSDLPPKRIRDHLVTFLFAGHETTASSLTWTLYLLSQNPEADQAIRDECVRKFGKSSPTLGDLRDLSLTLNTYQESLRLFPPSWTLAREAIQETRIGDHPVKKGSLLLVGVSQIQKHPDFWSDGNRFDPQRFESEEERHPYSFIPFGGGSRICIGQRTALIEAALFLAMAVPRFRFHPRPGFKPEVEALITAHPKGDFPVRVERVVQQ